MMKPTHHVRLMALFDRAIELTPNAQRALIAEVRTEDSVISEELEALLDIDSGRQAAVLVGSTQEQVAALANSFMEMEPQDIGSFRLHTIVGRGGAGVVWRARHSSGREVAVKVLPGRSTDRAFSSEVRAVAALDHPGIVRVFDYGTADVPGHGAPRPYLAMELLGSPPRPKNFDDLQTHLCELLEALAHAHARGVIHRDVKPGNVLLDEQGRAVLSDFGIAWSAEGDEAPQLAGTPGFMAPEQFAGSHREQGPSIDLYALGCLAWFWSTGSAPFGGPDMLSDNEKGLLQFEFEPTFMTPPGFEAWLRVMLAVSPAGRPPGCAQALTSLYLLTGADRSWTQWRDTRPTPYLAGVGLGLFGLRRHAVVGRQEECRTLTDTLNSVCAGRAPRVVVLRGQAGVGKTRLSAWLGEYTLERGQAGVLSATHSVAPGPYDGIAPALRQTLDITNRREAERHLGALALPKPFHEKAVELLAPTRGLPSTEVGETAGRILVALARRRPVVVRIDDAQWGVPSLQALSYVLGKTAPILAVITLRDDLLVECPEAAALLSNLLSRELQISPLSAEAQRSLIEKTLGLSPPLAQKIADRTRGNPLFAVQLVADLVHRAKLESGESGFELVAGARAELPEEIHDVWVARISALLEHRPPEDRLALEVAALLGPSVDALEWNDACARANIGPPMELVLEMLRSGLADGHDPKLRWDFTHGLLSESLARLNREGGRDRVAGDAVRRALHTQAKAALARGVLTEAGALLSRAAPFLPDSADIDSIYGRCTQAEVWGGTQKSDKCVQEYRLALAEARPFADHDLTLACLTSLGKHLSSSGHPHDAIALLNEALDLSTTHSRLYWQERALSGLANAHAYLGNNKESIRFCEQALERTRASGANLAIPLGNLGLDYLLVGRLDEALDLFGEAIDIARAADERLGETHWQVLAGDAEMLRGRTQHAVEYFNNGLAIATEDGNRRLESWALAGLGEARWRVGDPIGACDLYQSAIVIVRELGDRSHESRFLLKLAEVLECGGTGTTEAADRVATIVNEIEDSVGKALLACNRGHAALAAGEDATEFLKLATERCDKAGMLPKSDLGQAVERLKQAYAARTDTLLFGRCSEKFTAEQLEWFASQADE